MFSGNFSRIFLRLKSIHICLIGIGGHQFHKVFKVLIGLDENSPVAKKEIGVF
jgi:hypothetical protein